MKTTQFIFRPVLSLMFLVLLLSASPAFAASIIWEDDFTNGVTTGVDEHTVWDTLVTELGTAATLNSVTMSGTFDTTGITCTDPAATQQIADLITSHTTGTVACGGHDWHYCVRDAETFDFWLDPPASCATSNCPDPGYLIRPKQINSNWGGISSATCNAPSQSMKLEFGDVPTQPTYSVGGTVSGLTGTGLALQNNGGDTLAVAAPGTAFTFSTELLDLAAYAVTVLTQPTGQTCTVTNGSGTIAAADVTDVAVDCVDNVIPTYSVGGTVSGLTGTGLALQNNGVDTLAIAIDGPFTFLTELVDTAAYAATVSTQPTGQTCSVTNGSGAIAAADVTDVAVDCVDDVVVVPPTPAAPIPTMSQWALIMLSMFLGLMVFANRKRLF